MKKKIISLAVAAFVLAVWAAPVLAHGHRGGRARSYSAPTAAAVSYSVCGIADCALTGLHAHNGINYYAHYYNDGHDYHGYCNIENCTIAGYHGHDGTYCFGHTAYDGHNYYYGGGCHRY